MPDNGFDIDLDPVRETCADLKVLRADFDEVHRYVSEADPEAWMWGATGLAFAAPYLACAQAIRLLMSLLGPASEGLVERIERACADYEETDERTARQIERVSEALSGGGIVR